MDNSSNIIIEPFHDGIAFRTHEHKMRRIFNSSHIATLTLYYSLIVT